MKQIICPVSNEKINEGVVRVTALFGIFLILLGIVFNSFIYPAMLLLDFFIRGFTKAKYSPLSWVSKQLINAFKPTKIEIDKAPKIFAARLGFFFTLIFVLLLLFESFVAAKLVGGVLIVFSSLEFLCSFCVGCLIYSYIFKHFSS